jgi:4'-phosphopantetheinyl transferase
MRERLGDDEVHVWTVNPETIRDPGLVERYAALESDDERERRLRLRFERHRHERLVSTALVRASLSRYADGAPEDWIFERGAHGRPEIAPGQAGDDLRFNLSHTTGLVACAVTRGRDVGVDVERTRRRGEPLAIAERYFSEREVRDLHAVPDAQRRERFFDYWTLKEAYVKARGRGLALGLRRFSFVLEESAPIRVAFATGFDDDPSAWQFALFRPDAGHVLAVAVRRGLGSELGIRLHDAVPLA